MDKISYIKTIRETTTVISRWFFFACLLTTPIHTIAAQQPIIISSADSHYQQSLVQSILNHLKETGIQARTVDHNWQPAHDLDNELIISIGKEASTLLRKKNISAAQLSVYTEVDSEKDIENKNTMRLSMTQSICQQFSLAHFLNEEWKNISVLISNRNTPLIQKLELCAAQNNLTLKTIALNEYVSIIDALNSSLLNSDALLALPDPDVYNARTIKGILLTTYRHRVPVIGFSESFVRAGSLAAIHSSTEQLGRQIAEIVERHYSDKNTSNRHIYPKYFDIEINKDVAKSLGITVPDRKSLLEKIKGNNHE